LQKKSGITRENCKSLPAPAPCSGPVKGHEFGLGLAPDDKQALIAFLKTL
jgi:hypothetical protein